MSQRIKPFGSKTDFNEGCDNDNFIMEEDTQSTEGKKTQDNVWQTQDNYFLRNMLLIKSDSHCDLTTENDLLEKNDSEIKINELQKDDITIFDRFEDNKSDVPHIQRYQLSNSENCLSLSDNEHSCNLSSCRMNLSLPTIPISCTDEENTLFNQSQETKHFSCDAQPMNKEIFHLYKNDRLEHECDTNKCETLIETRHASIMEQDNEKIIESQLQTSNNETLNKKVQELKDVYKETESRPGITLHSNVRNNLMSQSTLANDSKLVKIPLPINIMQSNVQLLNKSRDFFNYITEKSTNIMEKALLPQHLSMRYNHVSKPIERDITKMPCADKTASSIDIMSSLDTNLISNMDNIIDITNSVEKQNSDTNTDKLDNAIVNKSLFSKLCTKENKQYDNIKEKTEYLYNNDLEGGASNEKDHILEKNYINEISSDTGDGKTECDIVVTKINTKCEKQTFLQTEKVDNDIGQCKKESPDICTPTDTNILKCDLLEHPLYSMLLENYTCLKNQNLKLLEKMEYLERSKQSNKVSEESQINTNTFNLQVESLGKTIDKLTAKLNTSLVIQEALKNECMAANKEKENMVMKYVISEKQLIDSQRLKDSAERKIKEILKEQELLQNKLRQTQDERTKINNILTGKNHQVADFRKEIENLQEDIKLKEIKLKWTQNKLHSEMDLQKDTQQKLDKALMKINNMKEECEQIRRETQESFRKFQQSEENKAVTLDQQLKEHQARLILERHVIEDKEVLRLQLQKEMELLKSRQKDLIEENKRLNFKIEECEKTRSNYEKNLSDLKLVANQRQEQITEMSKKLSELAILKLQLQQKEEYVISIEAEVQQLRSVNEDLQSDMQACRQKEADILNFTQKLTDKNVRLQSDFNAIQAKANRLESEHDPLRTYINKLTNKIKTLEEDLIQEQKKRKEECEILATHLAEQTQLAQNFAHKLEDSEGENVVLKRKHQISIKELTRELQQCRGKLEMFETASPSNSLDVISRTGSNTSLNTGDTLNSTLTDNDTNGEHALEPNRKVLMDFITKLQKINIKRAEKIFFLEEHTQELTEEIQKKEKIIQNYILNQNYGALGCNERDKNKAELARHGGIMASFYNNRVSDENMTLELSLEINKKLQAILEDILLKNITLKDNIDTLGNEIARLQNNLNKDRLKINN